MGPADPQTLRAAADHLLELHDEGRLEEALDACLELERAAGDDLSDPVVRESVFTARFERGVLSAELGDLPAAAAGYLAAAALPFDDRDPDQSHEVAMALLNAGICWTALGDDAAALATYDELLSRVGGADGVVTADQVVRARVNRAAALLALGRAEAADAAAREVVHALDATDPGGAEQRSLALRVRAAALRERGRLEDAVLALAEAEAAPPDEAGARVQVLAAQGERAELLRELGRETEAIDVLDDATARFADDADVHEVVTELVRVEAELLEAVGDRDRAAAVRARRAV